MGMANKPQQKQRNIFFYLMSIARQKNSSDTTIWCGEKSAQMVSGLLSYLMQKSKSERSYHIEKQKKYVWLHEYTDLNNSEYDKKGDFNIVFMSGKYDQSREVVGTPSLTDKGIVMQPEDAPKEKTHMCIRRAAGQDRFIVACESNSTGITTTSITIYLNEMFKELNEKLDEDTTYKVSFEVLPSKDFLEELQRMKKISLIKVTMNRQDLTQDDFSRLAGLDELRDDVELIFKKKRGRNIPTDIVKEYYNKTGETKRFSKIFVDGAGITGNNLRLDSKSMQMKHSVTVDTILPTNEVNSDDFFLKVQEVIKEMEG